MDSDMTIGRTSDYLNDERGLGIDDSRDSTIGEMASRFGLSARTLRFYEDRKLLRPRREGNSRIYGAGDQMRLQMIIKGKQLGFTLTEISEFIGAQDMTDDFEKKLEPRHIVTQIDHLDRQKRDIEAAISRLRATHARLTAQVPEPSANS